VLIIGIENINYCCFMCNETFKETIHSALINGAIYPTHSFPIETTDFSDGYVPVYVTAGLEKLNGKNAGLRRLFRRLVSGVLDPPKYKACNC
jgi:hypothetical protein